MVQFAAAAMNPDNVSAQTCESRQAPPRRFTWNTAIAKEDNEATRRFSSTAVTQSFLPAVPGRQSDGEGGTAVTMQLAAAAISGHTDSAG